MFDVNDLGSEVKIVKINGDRIRGVVLSATGADVTIDLSDGNTEQVLYSDISTVTHIGDFSS